MSSAPFSPRPAARTARVFLACGALLLGVTAAGCRRGRSSGAQVPSLKVAYDVRPIDAANLHQDAAALRRALGMPAGEVAARLGSFAATSDVSFSLGNNANTALQERMQTQLTWDGAGNVQASHRGSRHGFELVAVDEKAYVRLDRGHLRGKGRRDMDVAELVEIAYSGLRQATQQFGALRLGAPTAVQLGGRDVHRYTLQGATATPAGEADAAAKGGPGVLFPPGALPAVAPGSWRQHPGEPQVSGSFDVDAATGVVVAARLSGRRPVAEQNGRTLQLMLQLRHQLTDLGKASRVREPATSVSEYRRPVRPREPLAFFRDQLPAPAAAPAAAPR